MTDKELAQEWIDNHAVLLEWCPEDLCPERTSWETLENHYRAAYYTLREIASK